MLNNQTTPLYIDLFFSQYDRDKKEGMIHFFSELRNVM